MNQRPKVSRFKVNSPEAGRIVKEKSWETYIFLVGEEKGIDGRMPGDYLRPLRLGVRKIFGF